MTSQVAVYNLNGIGIASDTVATSRTDAGPKTTGNSEKIYEVGPNHKVVALHYGSTTLNDLHHQFHFNRWVETLTDALPSIEAYVASYVAFSENSPRYHTVGSEAVELRYVMRNHYEELLRRMVEQRSMVYASTESESDRADLVANWVTRVIKEGWDYLLRLETFEGVTETDAKAWFKQHKLKPKDIWEEMFDGEFELSASDKALLTKSGALCVTKSQDLEWDSNLAFIGYGTDDPFPSVKALICRSLVGGKLLAYSDGITTVGPGNNASEITRFAQSDAIESFLRGFNTDINNAFSWAIGKFLSEAMGEDVDWDVVNSVQEKATGYVTDYAWRTYTRPMLRQIQGMNVNTLGELANTLVGMQATSSASKDGPVSVGGLIEVVTIDRINGVQWKSRLPR